MKKMMPIEKFVKIANLLHDNKFNYDKTILSRMNSKIIITCPFHGNILVTANDHIRKTKTPTGCKLCTREGKTKSKENFIKEAKLKHGDKYNYDKTEYKNAKTKVCIICPEHGDYWQTPDGHLRGGCKHCSDKQNGISKVDKFDFIKESKKKFGNKYDYSKTIYTGIFKPIILICPTHGEIKISANIHLKSPTGCSLCSRQNHPGRYTIKKFSKNNSLKFLIGRLYFLRIYNNEEEFYKIGIASISIKRRYALNKYMLSSNKREGYSNYTFEILLDLEMNLYKAFLIEQKILNKYSIKKYIPKNYFRGYSECLSENLTQKILGLCKETCNSKSC